jgi:hypothetical protein
MLHLIERLSPAILDSAPNVTELITPYLPLLGTLVGATVVGIFALWNRKRGSLETRAPDVNEIWQQQATQSRDLDIERKLRRMLEDLLSDLRKAFRMYVDRVQGGGSLELTDREKRLLNKPTPTPDHVNLNEPQE